MANDTSSQQLKEKLKTTWSTGDFGVIAKTIESHANTFVERLNIKPEMEVLDVACGTGNAAIVAARQGAHVTGIDITPTLLDQAQARAKSETLEIHYEEGDAEELPYENDKFELVMTMYGAIFASDPEAVTRELIRVCRADGTIAMANWTADGFIGQMLKVIAAHIPPPAGKPSPLLWGDEKTVRERFGKNVSVLTFKKVPVSFTYPFTVAKTVEYYREYYGPIQLAFNSLSEDKQIELRRDLEDVWQQHNQSSDGTVDIETYYLEVIAKK